MKLSTFCKLVKKEYISYFKDMELDPSTSQAYVCNLTSALAETLGYKHPAQQAQYTNLEAEVRSFIQVQISPEKTVMNYLAFVQGIKANLETAHRFRLALLEDMIDWAQASE